MLEDTGDLVPPDRSRDAWRSRGQRLRRRTVAAAHPDRPRQLLRADVGGALLWRRSGAKTPWLQRWEGRWSLQRGPRRRRSEYREMQWLDSAAQQAGVRSPTTGVPRWRARSARRNPSRKRPRRNRYQRNASKESVIPLIVSGGTWLALSLKSVERWFCRDFPRTENGAQLQLQETFNFLRMPYL